MLNLRLLQKTDQDNRYVSLEATECTSVEGGLEFAIEDERVGEYQVIHLEGHQVDHLIEALDAHRRQYR